MCCDKPARCCQSPRFSTVEGLRPRHGNEQDIIPALGAIPVSPKREDVPKKVKSGLTKIISPQAISVHLRTIDARQEIDDGQTKLADRIVFGSDDVVLVTSRPATYLSQDLSVDWTLTADGLPDLLLR